MGDYCVYTDVQERLGRDLSFAELGQFAAFLQDASVLQIDPVLGKSYVDASPMPPVITSVAANIIARTYRQNAANPLGADVTVGPVRMGAVVKMLPSEEKALRMLGGRSASKLGVISTERGDLCLPEMVNVNPFTAEWTG